MTHNLFCFGFGYTAQHLVKTLASDWHASGTTRSHEKTDRIRGMGADPVVWTGGALSAEALIQATHILVSTPPGDDGCPSLEAIRLAHNNAKGLNCGWIGYLSTNGVYGDHDGAWVDEDSPLRGNSDRSVRRIRAEQDWQVFAKENDLPLTIFRLPGIYGPGRSALDTVRAGQARRIYKERQVFSRMHVADIAQALSNSMMDANSTGIFNLADDEPAPPQDVIEYACQLLGEPVPPLIPIDAAEMSEMARSFYTDNKRVSNARMKRVLNVTLAYPTYREGLDAILTSGA